MPVYSVPKRKKGRKIRSMKKDMMYFNAKRDALNSVTMTNNHYIEKNMYTQALGAILKLTGYSMPY